MLAAMILKKEPFFHSKNDPDQLVKIAKVLGTEDLFKYLERYDIELNEELHEEFDDVSGWYSKKSWYGLSTQRTSDSLAMMLLTSWTNY